MEKKVRRLTNQDMHNSTTDLQWAKKTGNV